MDKEKREIPKEIPVIHLDQSDLSADWIKEMRTPVDKEIHEKIKREMDREKEGRYFGNHG